ncbi:DUF1697 domain-containing protein [Nocardioides sp.]|uniref:DUF1697 domain-containing protein n=1 Tax=Nocardioides sp. TaxID=35761 RepID=UPI0035129E48
MPTYVAFLRAINLGATRKFPKASIVAATESAGATDVATHINTGNVRLTTRLRSRERVEQVLEEAYAEHAGFDVPVIAFTAAEFAALADRAAALSAERAHLERHYVHLLKSEPDAARLATLPPPTGAGRLPDGSGEFDVVVHGRAAHVLVGPGHTAGNADPARIERTLGVVATNRNVNVVTTIAGLWCR